MYGAGHAGVFSTCQPPPNYLSTINHQVPSLEANHQGPGKSGHNHRNLFASGPGQHSLTQFPAVIISIKKQYITNSSFVGTRGLGVGTAELAQLPTVLHSSVNTSTLHSQTKATSGTVCGSELKDVGTRTEWLHVAKLTLCPYNYYFMAVVNH